LPLLAVALSVAIASSPAGQASQPKAPASAAQGPAAPSAGGRPTESFDSLAARARAAFDAGRTDEAVRLYGRALGLRPAWDEGWWYLGSAHYEARRGAEAEKAFASFLKLKADSGPGWTMRGLAAFEAKSWPAAIEFLQKGLDLGLGGNAELVRAGRQQLALALVKTGQFELAVQPLTLLSRTTPEGPLILTAVGLLVLRLPMLPSEVPTERRELVISAGRAGYLHMALRADEAGKAYADLVARYPDEPWVHYAHGVFLMRTDSEAALRELRRELEVKPDNVMAQLEIAFELITRGEHGLARPYAESAAKLAPGLFAARNAKGRVLVELGELEAGIRELEEGVRLAPESPEMHFALARAYGQAGRSEDAARERALFAELDRKRREKRGGGSAAPDAAPLGGGR
jgi:tetratricopeptide (TPR) repeat protein